MFGEKTLTDVVKGIRASRRDTSLYISQCIAEIKTEINSSDMFVKANALQKLTFLQMMGYSMSWASFASIELMSSPRFAHKRIAYLAASQGFTQDTDVILLTTNLLKKELRGGVYEAGLAINCISNIVTEDLARDLLPELTSLTSHPQPYIRKKAILCLFKVFVKFPQGLRLSFTNIQQCLDDSNPSVVSCAVNVITELSDKNPKNYLHLAPAFFQLLTDSSNNWMLIKVVKLLGSLVPEEPRLARKLLEPLAGIVRNTKAKSLLYEAVHTITLCLPYCRRSDGSMPANVPEIVKLCAETLQSFVNEHDQNLKYLGLVGFASLMQSHPRVLSAPGYRPLILACLSDQDVTIRTRALSLLSGMASKKNLMELVTQLLKHVELATGSYKLDLVSKIIEMCTTDKYSLLENFAWYLNVLFQLGHMRGLDAHSALLRSQISDVALRVLPVRLFAVRRSIEILLERDGVPSADPYGDNGRGRHIMPEILPAIAWIVGEYSDLIQDSLLLSQENNEMAEFLLDDSSKGTHHSIIQDLTSTSNFQKFPAETQQVFLQAALKVFAAATANSKVSSKELEACCATLKQNLPLHMQSIDVEVQERAFTGHSLLVSIGLIAARDSAPEPVSSNENSDSDDSEHGKLGGVDGDLLGMSGETIKTLPYKELSIEISAAKDLSSRCRQASSVLNYILKPSPMKPTSAKTQRKKSHSQIGVDTAELEAIDLSVFSNLWENDSSASADPKVDLESVSFTQQAPVRLEPRIAISSAVPQGSKGASIGMAGGGNIPSFQHAEALDVFDDSGGGARQSQADPFYLDSAPKSKTENTQGQRHFGMIQLSDSDEGGSAIGPDKRKKDKKKKKRKKKTSSSMAQVGHISGRPVTGVADVAVYDSDDDDHINTSLASTTTGQKRGPAKEFEGLAKVDLTAPLREDEVMPERKHHIVKESSVENDVLGFKGKVSKKGKKSKKEKKEDKMKRKGKAVQNDPYGNVGDLLGMTGFGNTPSIIACATTSATALSHPTAPAKSNAITSAFEDLLDLQTAAPQLPDAHPTPSSFNGSQQVDIGSSMTGQSNGPWIRASVKVPKSSGLTQLDPSSIGVHFRVSRPSQVQVTAGMLIVRVLNAGPTYLNGVSLQLGGGAIAFLGDIKPNSFRDSEQLGPFSYQGIDSSFDIKGSLSIPAGTVTVKFGMPLALFLTPWEGLTMEDVSSELSSQNLDSRSVRIPLSAASPRNLIKATMKRYLDAAEVELEGACNSATTGTLAAQSAGGARLLVLLKVKDDSVKLDLKCTRRAFGKDLASDLKRIVF